VNTVTELKPTHHVSHGFAKDQPADVASTRLQIDVDHRGPAVIIHARGEVDAYTLPTWRRLIRGSAALATAPGPLIIDITRLDFIACSGLAALANQGDACREQGTNMIVVSCASIVHRVATATGLEEHLSICSSTEAALRSSNPVVGEGITKEVL
jgi:anti-anti-sigma factor